MSTVGNLTAAGAVFGLLAGCAGTQLESAKMTQTSGSAFDKKLYSDYIDLAQAEYDEGDYRDSDMFASRAMSAAKNQPTDPEAITARRLPASQAGELQGARERLVSAFAGGARDKMPDDSAHAQAMFDCWMQEQEENFQPADISRCRTDFNMAMAKIDEGMMPRQTGGAMLPAEPKPVVKRYVVYFPFDSSKLTSEAADTVKRAIADTSDSSASVVSLYGHTDTKGTDQYNVNLSSQRLETVVDAMKTDGFAPGKLNTMPFGEKDLPVATADDVANPENRRVEIVITQRGGV